MSQRLGPAKDRVEVDVLAVELGHRRGGGRAEGVPLGGPRGPGVAAVAVVPGRVPPIFGFAGRAQIAIGAFPKLASVVPEKG
jgi:hypothetical protein